MKGGTDRMSPTREWILEQIDTSFRDYQQSKLFFLNRSFERSIEFLVNSINTGLTIITVCYSGETTCSANLALVEFLVTSEKLFNKKHLFLLKTYSGWIEQPKTNLPSAQDLAQWLSLAGLFIEAVDSYSHKAIKAWYSTPKSHQAERRFYRGMRHLGGLIFSLLVLSYVLFFLKKPTQYNETKGQFFWTTIKNDLPSEEYSLRFKVIEDGAFHTYTIQSFVPITTTALRFDPITESHSKIWIDFIDYYTGDSLPVQTQSFDQSLDGWMPQQDMKVVRWEKGFLYLETSGNDPFLSHSNIKILELIAIKIRMKVLFYQSYIQWLFT